MLAFNGVILSGVSQLHSSETNEVEGSAVAMGYYTDVLLLLVA